MALEDEYYRKVVGGSELEVDDKHTITVHQEKKCIIYVRDYSNVVLRVCFLRMCFLCYILMDVK